MTDPATIPIELRTRDWRYIINVLQSREDALRAQGQEDDLDEEGEHIRGLIQDIEAGLLKRGNSEAGHACADIPPDQVNSGCEAACRYLRADLRPDESEGLMSAIDAKTSRDMLLEQIADSTAFWATVPGLSDLQRCNSVAHSILLHFAGGIGVVPRVEMTLRPYPEDREFCEIEGLSYFIDGTRIDEPPLHESWDKFKRG